MVILSTVGKKSKGWDPEKPYHVIIVYGLSEIYFQQYYVCTFVRYIKNILSSVIIFTNADTKSLYKIWLHKCMCKHMNQTHQHFRESSTALQWIRCLFISVLSSFHCFIYPSYWTSSLTIIWRAFPYPLIKKSNYLEPVAVTECQKSWLAS